MIMFTTCSSHMNYDMPNDNDTAIIMMFLGVLDLEQYFYYQLKVPSSHRYTDLDAMTLKIVNFQFSHQYISSFKFINFL